MTEQQQQPRPGTVGTVTGTVVELAPERNELRVQLSGVPLGRPRIVFIEASAFTVTEPALLPEGTTHVVDSEGELWRVMATGRLTMNANRVADGRGLSVVELIQHYGPMIVPLTINGDPITGVAFGGAA